MSSSDPPLGAHVSYRRQYRRCGKVTCARCAADGPGHGPYWYAFWWEDGRPRSRYVGKRAPAGAGEPEQGAPVPGQISAATLRVRTLGGFVVWRGETVIGPERWTSHRAAALFKCLLSAPKHRLPREQLIELLWPEVEPAAGATNLRTTLHLLRQVLDHAQGAGSYLRAEGNLVALAPAGAAEPADDWLDATAFAQSARAALAGQDAAACRTALALYGGDYLPDELYTEWTAAPRETLRRHYLELLLHLATLSGAWGELEEAEDCLRRVLATEPGHEEAAATLMGLLAASGRRAEALRVYQALATVLEEELDVTPGAEIAALRAQLLAQEAVRVAAPIPAGAAPLPLARRSNLPVALTSFVGRAWDVKEVAEALVTARLVTLTGPGGCGKTRLALQVAGALVEAYADGVWLVELAALADPTLAPQAVRLALGLAEQPHQAPLATLSNALQRQHLLLVIDNCEHLRGACAEMATALLHACPHLHLLATSREPLAVAGERPYLVPPLAVPDPDHLPPPERLAAYESVELFLQRAQARQPTLTLSAANAGDVAQICARLDGLPLALELAAARVGLLPIASIVTRLDNRFRLLTGGPRTALPRQQTLRATLDWSYRLLRPGEQALLAQLAVFAGGCTPAGAEAVCGSAEEREIAVLDGLSSLADKGLLQPRAGAGAESRFAMLETIRAYATEQLEKGGEAETVRRRHAQHYLGRVEEAATHLWGPRQRLWLERLEDECDNLRAALRWLLDRGEATLSLRFAAAAWRFWQMHSRLIEGDRWLEEVLALGQAGPAPLRGPVLYGAGVLAYRRGDYTQAHTMFAGSLALCREVGDSAGMARAINALANLALDADGDSARAKALYWEGLELSKEARDTWTTATCLANLGLLALDQGDNTAAQAHYEDSLVLRRSLGDAWAIAESLTNLARVTLELGDEERAAALARESVDLLRDLGDKRSLADCVTALAAVRVRQGQPEQAARLWAAAQTLLREGGATLEPCVCAWNERWLATGRAQVSAANWQAAWMAGVAMTPEQAVAEALRGAFGA